MIKDGTDDIFVWLKGREAPFRFAAPAKADPKDDGTLWISNEAGVMAVFGYAEWQAVTGTPQADSKL